MSWIYHRILIGFRIEFKKNIFFFHRLFCFLFRKYKEKKKGPILKVSAEGVTRISVSVGDSAWSLIVQCGYV